jgi:O-antigen ligase
MATFIMPLSESWKRSTAHSFDADQNEMESSARDGTLARQVTVAAIGLCGLFGIALRGEKTVRLHSISVLMLAAFLAWCAASFLWSDDPKLTLKRWIALVCMVAMSAAIAKQCSLIQFGWILVIGTTSWLALGIAAEMSLGTFRPWESGYRFAGIFHPNEMGTNCAILLLSGLYFGGTAKDQRIRSGLLLAATIGALFLLLTGSRTAVATVLAAAALWSVMGSLKKVVMTLIVATAAAGLLCMVLAFSQSADSSGIVAMGRDEDGMSTLTGRLPLWEELVEVYAQRQPLFGYGYGAFWTADRIFAVSDSQGWAISSTHSTYIDLLLSVGYVGLVLCVSAFVLALIRFWWLELKHPNSGYGLMAMLVVLLLGGGFLETTISSLSFICFFCICGLFFLLFNPDDNRLETGNTARVASSAYLS